jgi:hypothetical protein
MNACVIMHNMITKDRCGKDLDCTNYELMGCPVHVHWREHRVTHFINSYHQFGTMKCMMIDGVVMMMPENLFAFDGARKLVGL